MPIVTGVIRPWGPTLDVKVMQSNQRSMALRKAGRMSSPPIVVPGLIDTGASISALDLEIVRSLGLEQRGETSIHTPSTGTDHEKKPTFDAMIIVGETTGFPLHVTVPVIGCELATQGFSALIGRNVLRRCRFTYDGPSDSFTLEFGTT
jgi:hypothetical protein